MPELVFGLLAQFGDGADLLVLQIPFVDRNDDGAAFLLDQVGDALVLLLEGVLDVEQHHRDLGEAHGVERVGDRQLFQLLIDARAAAQAGGVMQAEFLPVPFEIDGDGVAGRAGLRRSQQPFLADQPVDKRRFAGIGASDDGDADRLRFLCRRFALHGRRGALGQRRAQGVVEIAHAFVVLGRDRHRVAKAEFIGFEPAFFGQAALALVGNENRRLAGLAGQRGEGAVDRRRAGARVDHEEDRVGLRNRGLGLRPHAAGQTIGRRLFEAGGIDHGEFKIAEPRLALAAVARHARAVVDQRQAAADQPVEQGRFADIRPADDGDGEAHAVLSLPGNRVRPEFTIGPAFGRTRWAGPAVNVTRQSIGDVR